MQISELFKQYVEHLFSGKRCESRELIFAAQDRGIPASKLLKMVVWKAMEQVEKLYRADEISQVVEHMATRINRMVADQLHGLLARKPKSGKRMIVTCGDGQIEELGAQIIADLFEADGWSVWFLGSGVPNDEILELVGKLRPDVLCVYGAQPCGVPNIRRLIELVRDVNACDEMQILVTGGVFNRADGLAEEIKADLFAPDVSEAIKVIDEHPVRIPKPDVPEPGRRRKQKKKAAAKPSKARTTRPRRRIKVAVSA
ncbi:MAG: cobalamin-dependent protein [Planctomycetota bacterium]|nr:cobalamin-dependent protein [Planctomycetota bacterium]